MTEPRSIIAFFENIPDKRRTAGQRHDQTLILVIVLMSTMSGYLGYRAIGDFIKRNKDMLLLYLKPYKGRLPSFDTVRRVIMDIDFEHVCEQFKAWAQQYVGLTDHEWISIDGKAIAGTTLIQNENHKQNFTSLVSVFCSKQKLVLSNGEVINAKQSEIPVVQQLIEALGLKGVTFTMDALHCQKKLQE